MRRLWLCAAGGAIGHCSRTTMWRRRQPVMRSFVLALLLLAPASSLLAAPAPVYFDVVPGSGPHDVAAAPGGNAPVYYTAQRTGKLGILDPRTGKVEEVDLGPRSAPHGVI